VRAAIFTPRRKPMPDICLCFQVRLAATLLPPGDIRACEGLSFEDHAAANAAFDRLAESCYLPANRMLGEAIAEHGGRFRIALSIGGSVIERMRRHRPDVLESFRQLVATGGVELLAEPWHHSLAFLHSNREFDRQVDMHLQEMDQLFHVRPRVFLNTDLIYNDAIAAKAETMGFDGVMAEGGEASGLLRAPDTARIVTLPRHTAFSSALAGNDGPSHEFARRMAESGGGVLILLQRYEALAGVDGGMPAKRDFWQSLPTTMQDEGLQWLTPSEAVDLYDAASGFPCPRLSSWDDPGSLRSPWEGNARQIEAMERIHEMEKRVHGSGDAEILDAWARLQASHHFHAMDGAAVDGLYGGPAEAHARLMAALERIEARLDASPQ
jgi:alpha-amylase